MPDLLEIGASFDWISPLWSVFQNALNGPSHCFLIPIAHSPYTGRDIGQMLGKKGVKCWGLMIVSGTLMVNVRLSQARWAQHLLEQNGVPIDNPIAGQEKGQAPKVAKQSAGPRVKSKGWTCGHCGNWYKQRPTSCKGCGGNYFVGWR
jgi:hypothetical protein